MKYECGSQSLFKTLMAALNACGYDQHDVVSLRFGGGGSIILYVHQRDMR